MPFSFYASSHSTLTNSPSKSLNTSATASLQPTHLLSSVLQYLGVIKKESRNLSETTYTHVRGKVSVCFKDECIYCKCLHLMHECTTSKHSQERDRSIIKLEDYNFFGHGTELLCTFYLIPVQTASMTWHRSTFAMDLHYVYNPSLTP